jgi:hypothetical protein
MRAFWCIRPAGASLGWLPDHSHSIINKPPEPAWLKGLAEIDMGLTVTSTVNRVELLLTQEIDRFAG